MIEGVRVIGEAVLQKQPLVDALVREEDVPKGEKRYVVHLNLSVDPPQLRVNVNELDLEVLTGVLWVGNAPGSNSPQDRLTTDHIEYLTSQTLPNLRDALDDCELRKKLETLINALYLDLGEKAKVFPKGGDGQYPRYRCMWDLNKLGLAKLDLIEKKDDRKELEALCKEQGLEFLTKPFLQAYARHKGKAKAAVELVAKMVETWVLKELQLKPRDISLYTLQLNGQPLARHPDYVKYLEKSMVDKAFEEARDGICHVCGYRREVTADTTRFKLLKFYITDKPGFASGLSKKGFVHNYTLCRECYRALLGGERFIENRLSTRLGRNNVYVLPLFHLPSITPTAATLEHWAKYLKERVAATQTLEQWQKFQDALKGYKEFENTKASFVLNLLFATKAQGAVKVDKLIQDVPPSRLDRLDEVRNKVRNFANSHFRESHEWDLSLGCIFYLFPIHKQGNQAQTRPFLEFLDALLTGRPLQVKSLIPKFLETASVHYFERYDAYVQDRPGQDLRDVDRVFTAFLLQSQLLLVYLKKLDQLEDFPKGGDLMEMEGEALDKELRAYLEELGLARGQRALFLLGYLIGRIGSTREQRESGKPILNKVHFQGMDKGKVMRLANEVYEKLRQYKIADYNEGVYAEMKALVDRELADLDSPQQNTYWLLSGYAYATWQGIKHGKKDQQGQKEGQA